MTRLNTKTNTFNSEIKKFNDENCGFHEMTLNQTLEESKNVFTENFEKYKYSKNYYNLFHDLEILKDNTEVKIYVIQSLSLLKKQFLVLKMIIIIKRFIDIIFIKNKAIKRKGNLALKARVYSLDEQVLYKVRGA